MSYAFNSGIQSEGNVEVHKYYGGVVTVVALLAIVIQAFLHRFGRWSEFADLPLLVTIYFGVSKRNPVSGMLLGAAIGIAQDALTHDNPIGLYGIAKTIIGYVSSSVGARIDTEHPASRFALVFILYHVHQFIYAGIERVLLNRPTPFFTVHLLVVSLVSAVVAVILFSLLDRLRRQS